MWNCRANTGLLSVVFALSCQAAIVSAPVQSLARLPLGFEENRGQAEKSARYLARTESGSVLFSNNTYRFGNREREHRPYAVRRTAREAVPTAESPLPGKANYFVGDERSWVRNVTTFSAIRYAAVYPGIDVVFYGNRRRLEYDFVLKPG